MIRARISSTAISRGVNPAKAAFVALLLRKFAKFVHVPIRCLFEFESGWERDMGHQLRTAHEHVGADLAVLARECLHVPAVKASVFFSCHDRVRREPHRETPLARTFSLELTS